MKKEAFAQFGHPDLILLAFMLFFFCFIGVTVFVFQRSRKNYYSQMAMIPLLEEEGSEVQQ